MKYPFVPHPADVFARIRAVLKASGQPHSFDKDIAAALGVSANMIAQSRHRQSLPWHEVTLWCVRNGLSINWIVFGQDLSEIRDGIPTGGGVGGAG